MNELELSERAAEAFAALRAPAAPVEDSPARIAIVGAGLAGLSAAVTLASKGVAADVYEASDRVGGRMHSNLDGYWSDGQTTEWCGEFVDSGHLAVRALAGTFGLELTDLVAAEPPGATDTWLVNGSAYTKEQALADFGPVRERLMEDLDAAGPETTWSDRTARGIALDSMTAAEWIASRVPGGAGSSLGRLIDLGYAAEFAADTADQSALNIVYMLGEQPDPEDLALLGESDERYGIEGGNERLPRAMAESLPRRVKHGWRLTAVAARRDGRTDLTFEAGGSRQAVTADHVILALPFAVLRTIDTAAAGLDERKRAAIDELGSGDSAKLALQFSSRQWAEGGPGGPATGSSLADTGYMCTWDGTRGQPGTGGVLVNYLGGAPARALATGRPYSDAGDAGVAARARDFLERVEPVFPGLSREWSGRATLSVPSLDPLRRGSYPYYRPGQYHRFGGYERVRSGNIHFAGDHCSQAFQGFMEGAAAEGYRAACEILGA